MPAQYLDFIYHGLHQFPFSLIDVALMVALVVFLRQERYFGSIRSAITLLKLFVTFLGSLALYHFLSRFVTQLDWYQGTADALSLLIIAALLFIGLQLVSNRFVIDSEKSTGLGRYFLYITGTLTFCLSTMWIIVFLLSFPFSPSLKALISDSAFSTFAQSTVTVFDIHLQQIEGNPTPQALNGVLITSSTSQSYDLHFKSITQKEQSMDESALYSFINQQRDNKHLSGLVQESDIDRVAQDQAKAVSQTGILSTMSPMQYTLYDRLTMANITYTSASEIAVSASSLPVAKTLLQNIPEAQQIILNPSYSSIGVSVIDTGLFGNVYILDFIKL